MLSHYLNAALRHFRQHKLTTSINVLCLTLGLASFIATWGTVAYFEQRDRYHEKADRTFFLTWKERAAADANEQLSTPFLLAPLLRADFPELDKVARLVGPNGVPVRQDGHQHPARLAFVDPEFFEIFDIPVRGTDPVAAMRQPHTALVSPAFAIRVFGTEDAIGRTLDLDGRELVTIAGLIGKIPQPSNFSTDLQTVGVTFDALVSMDTRVDLLKSFVPVPGNPPMGQWSPDGTITFLTLPNDGSLSRAQLNERLSGFVRGSVPPGPKGLPVLTIHSIADVMQLETQRLVGSVSGTTLLQLLGVLILVIACLNYTNLATAIAGNRMRDVALRKVVGASERSVMWHHLLEASLLASAALVAALIVVGAFAAAVGIGATELLTLYVSSPEFWIVLGAALVGVSLGAGGYPAFILARVRPIRLLRGAQGRQAGSLFASAMLTLQFAFASVMIIAVLTMLAQYREIRSAMWQPDRNPIVMILNGATRSKVDRQVLRNELLRVPGVLGVTGSVQALYDPGVYPVNLARSSDGKTSQLLSGINVVDYDFFATLDIPLLAGRDFERTRADDISDLRAGVPPKDDRNVIVDRRLAYRLGYATPQAAIGQTIIRPALQTASAASRATSARYHIVGVVEDSLVNPMPMRAEGNLFLLDPYTAAVPIVRISRNDAAATLAGMDAAWKRLLPEESLVHRFSDEHFERSFAQFRLVERMLMALSVLALLICTMGLTGMALHLVRRRMFEIGVRKTLGASVAQILSLLLRAFSKPVAIANVVVWPLMFVAASAYTSLFARSIGVPIVPFFLSLAITLVFAWIAVSIQVTRAARVKPAEVLRYE